MSGWGLNQVGPDPAGHIAGTFAGAEVWYAAGLRTASAVTAAATVADTLYLTPECFGSRVTLDRLALIQTTGNVGGNCRMGVWRGSDGTGKLAYPTTLLLDTGLTALVNSATGKTAFTVSLTLDPGWYWFGLVTGIIATIRSAATAPVQGSCGFPSTLGTSANVGLIRTQDEATPFSATIETDATIQNNTGIWLSYFRLSG